MVELIARPGVKHIEFSSLDELSQDTTSFTLIVEQKLKKMPMLNGQLLYERLQYTGEILILS